MALTARRLGVRLSGSSPVQPLRVEYTARLVHPEGRREQHYAVLHREVNHLAGRSFVPDEDNADHIHHLGGADDLRVDESGEKDRLILHVSEHVAHHVAPAGGRNVLREVAVGEDLCRKQVFDL